MTTQNNNVRDDNFSSRYRRFVLVMLTIVYAFNFIDRQILVILQEPIKADMGLTDAQLGLLSGFTFAVIYVTAGIPIAYLADRGNRRNIVAAALAVWSGMTALSGLVQSYGQLLLARVGVGLGEAGGSPPAHSMISDYYPPEQRGTALSFYSSGIYIGILLGYAFGGILADTFGWRAAFMVVGLPGILFAIVLALTVREPPRGRWDAAGSNDHRPSIGETLRLLRERRSFWYVAMGCALTSYVSYGNGNFLPSLLIRNHGMSVGDVGLVLSLVAGLSGAIGTFLGGYLGDRLAVGDRRWYVWVPAIGGGLAFFPYFYVILSNHTTSVLAVLAVVSVVNSLYLGPSIAIAHALVPPRMRALTSAVLFFVLNMIGLGLGPFFTGLASDLLAPMAGDQNLRWAMVITACVGLLAIGSFLLAARNLPADLARDGTPAAAQD
ncbi:spinster family MFS transporter [Pseudohaliea rubra]|uniref:Nitrate/nitrite transporter n=1 Tax=Pseudohaliea rubra DSM 19751 TaxID=1265313 RepID=A0A095VPT2_9GAMM|nr:MFS transporter [Pseudohaliea rubra]KGE03482.1 Nitrate/nitrite transporter [Pseudohaliea rubra DSM 19751]